MQKQSDFDRLFDDGRVAINFSDGVMTQGLGKTAKFFFHSCAAHVKFRNMSPTVFKIGQYRFFFF